MDTGQKRGWTKRRAIAGGLVAVLLLVTGGLGWYFHSRPETEPLRDERKENVTASAFNQKAVETVLDDRIHAELKQVNSWERDSRYFVQYDLRVVNDSEMGVVNWKMAFPVSGDVKIEQFWNCQITVMEETGSGKILLVPALYCTGVAAGNSTQGIGFIVSKDNEQDLSAYQLELTMADSTVCRVDGPEAGTVLQTGMKSSSETASGDKETKHQEENRPAAVPHDIGPLHVSGTKLTDEQGNPVQLKGVSTHGLAWYPEYVCYDTFQTLKDWGANVVRLAMYTAEYGGYCSGGDRAALKARIEEGVDDATQLGMYVIIDWHILSDGNPNTNKSDAVAFFDEMSSKYRDYDNVIYEICNEPVNASWQNEIKPYAEEVIQTIRKNDSAALILVGTSTWSQDVDQVAGNELTDENVMYVLHFYAGTHKETLRNKLTSALDAGVPVFVSECGICDASGNGGIDFESAQKWLDLINERGISFIAWNLSNKNESSSLLRPDCSALSGWSDEDLSESGRWFKAAIGQ